MPTGELLLLGAIAGLTIFIGLPAGRISRMNARLSVLLSSLAAGVLLFLFWDVLSAAVEPVESAITAGQTLRTMEFGTISVVCFGAGLLGLVYYERWVGARQGTRSMDEAGEAAVLFGEASEQARLRNGISEAENLSLLIAVGIGLHNFAEGLAIGQSAGSSDLSLTYALIIGFGLHNATEGFGIVGPLAGGRRLPSWGFLSLLGLIGGGPTFVGTVVGQVWTNEFVSVAFLMGAAGSILFVVNELLRPRRGGAFKDILAWGLLVGLFAGFATDWVLVAVGV